uniref:Protein CASP n=1 Tax=Candidozyma auris TaxID=498019 RepID=A0A0L0P2I5_CANAR
MAETTQTKQNAFHNALQSWKEIDLPSLQRKLDEQGIELKSEQKASLTSRKNLASKTKEFKKLEDEAKLTEMKPLLKLYQNEIDSMHSKQKKVESFFFGFYRVIAEAPDPKPLLELCLDAVSELNEVGQLKQEVTELKEKLAKKADYEVLKQRLLQSEQELAALLSTKLRAKEDELQSLMQEKETNWANKEKQHQEQIASYKLTIEELKTTMEVTKLQLSSHNKQLNDGGNDSVTGQDAASTLVELDMANRDAEMWKKRVLDLEKRNESLRQELSVALNDATNTAMKAEFQKRVADLESENALLMANLNQVKSKVSQTTEENALKVTQLARDLQHASDEIKHLKEKLERTSDYDEIKHELKLLRQIEFGDSVQEGTDDAPDEAKQIDALLIEKNKAMTTELANLRAEHDGLVAQVDQLQRQIENITEENARLNQLNSKLENDLALMQDSSSSHINDTASMMSGMTRMTKNTRLGPVGNPNSNEENSILPIVTKQRDRFRDKNKELEDELRRQINLVNELKRQNRALKSDNEDLYEKSRYVAQLKKGEIDQGVESAGSSLRRFFTPKPNASVDLEQNAYQTEYESKLHPIERFRMREQERISARLSPLERIFILITRSILATRTTRMLFLAYCVFLHFLVMFTTIHSMNISTKLIPEVGLNQSTGGSADVGAGFEPANRA